MSVRILVLNGSNRSGSFSGKLADAAMREILRQEGEVTRIALIDYPLPLMDEDLEREKGIPENALKLARLIASHDGLYIATPEYNGSIPPLLKNVIDWVSRVSRDGDRPLKPYASKVAALGSSSTGTFAGIRAIAHLRAILAHVGIQVVSEQCSVPNAQNAFDDAGFLKDDRTQQNIEKSARSLLEQAAFQAGKRS
jgi:chromate reductase, NAD(P)H dehydrogenase (quinone)